MKSISLWLEVGPLLLCYMINWQHLIPVRIILLEVMMCCLISNTLHHQYISLFSILVSALHFRLQRLGMISATSLSLFRKKLKPTSLPKQTILVCDFVSVPLHGADPCNISGYMIMDFCFSVLCTYILYLDILNITSSYVLEVEKGRSRDMSG